MALGFCAIVVSTAVGLMRGEKLARFVGTVVFSLFGLYCLSFLVMVGYEFGLGFYTAAGLGLGLVLYTLAALWIFGPIADTNLYLKQHPVSVDELKKREEEK